jgi:hypothetical protein
MIIAPLFKLLVEYLSHILKVDILFSNLSETEDLFLRDVLLFQKGEPRYCAAIDPETRAKEKLKNSCSVFSFNISTQESLKKLYGHRPPLHNLFKYIFESKCPQVQIPRYRKSIHGYLLRKNLALKKLQREIPSLARHLSPEDRRIIRNLELDFSNQSHWTLKPRESQRVCTREHAWLILSTDQPPIPARLLDISQGGLRLQLNTPATKSPRDFQDQDLTVIVQLRHRQVTAKCKINWVRDIYGLGCSVQPQSHTEWDSYLQEIWKEIDTEALQFKL